MVKLSPCYLSTTFVETSHSILIKSGMLGGKGLVGLLFLCIPFAYTSYFVASLNVQAALTNASKSFNLSIHPIVLLSAHSK